MSSELMILIPNLPLKRPPILNPMYSLHIVVNSRVGEWVIERGVVSRSLRELYCLYKIIFSSSLSFSYVYYYQNHQIIHPIENNLIDSSI
jgi:hypothetical protein